MNVKLKEAIFLAKIAEQERNVREQAEQCREVIRLANSSHMSVRETVSGGCPPVWDGIMCWSATPPATLVTQPCPSYFVGFNPNMSASKQCMSDGEWFVRLSTNRTWTNYTQCYTDRTTKVVIQFPDLGNTSLIAQYIPLIKDVSHVGYGVSLATLLIAFCIFATFKRLRCPRNKLHMHLFVSFMVRAFATLFKDSLFVKGIGLASNFIEKDGESYFVHESQYSWQCKLIVSVWQYCIMANYSWILMEGLYLHNLIFFSVFSDTSSIAVYVITGWGLPLMFVIPWVTVRALLEDTLCWTTNDNPYYFQLIKGPTTASVLINVILFLNIVRVLMSKLQASICEETRRFRYRKWAKSTLVLMPLFGVHYVVYLTLSYIGIQGRVELAWIFIDQLFASFQGFLVAVLYCLLNGEVRAELTKKWRRLPVWGVSGTGHRGSLPLNTFSSAHHYHHQQQVKRSYLTIMFSKRKRRSSHRHNRGSHGDTCLSTLVSSVVSEYPHSRPSITPKCMVTDDGETKLPEHNDG